MAVDRPDNAWLFWVRLIYLGLIIGTIGGMFAHNALDFAKKLRGSLAGHLGRAEAHASYAMHRYVERLTLGERIQHALLAISFFTLVYTGFALTYPERAATPVETLDFAHALTLEFEPPDLETFPLLALARRAGESGGTYPCAYNAANEVAVAAFLAGRLPFLRIVGVVEETLGAVDGAAAPDIDALAAADAEARRHAERAAGALVG